MIDRCDDLHEEVIGRAVDECNNILMLTPFDVLTSDTDDKVTDANTMFLKKEVVSLSAISF